MQFGQKKVPLAIWDSFAFEPQIIMILFLFGWSWECVLWPSIQEWCISTLN